MKRHLFFAALGLATALPLSACGADPGTTSSNTTTGTTSAEAAAPSSGAAAGATSSAGGSTSSDALPAEHNDADVMFAQMMIPHHQQAVEMSDLMLAQDGISLEITELATRIKEAQGPEIGTMTSLLEAWDEPVEPDGGMEGHSMDGTNTGMESDSGSMEGMMSEDQMSELESAEGVEASRIFLESMTAHHEGAIGMARNELDNGQNPEAVELAQTIVDTQKAEIDEMQELLEGL